MNIKPGICMAFILAVAVIGPRAMAADDGPVLYRGVDPSEMTPRYDRLMQAEPAAVDGSHRSHGEAYRTETFEATVAPRNQFEFMAEMEQGEVLLYTWEAGDTLYYEFHAHPEGAHPDYWSRYAEGKASSDSGSLVAPYTGEHGWLWLNTGSEPVTVRLNVSGYYRQVNRN